MQMTLPKMDVPVNVLEWELFMPDQYRVDRFTGNMLASSLFEARGADYVLTAGVGQGAAGGVGGGVAGGVVSGLPMTAAPGQIVGRILDPTGMPIPGATVVAEGSGKRQESVTDVNGIYTLSGLPSGPLIVTGQLSGFTSVRRSVLFDQRPRQVDMTLAVGGITESVTVNAEAPIINTQTSEVTQTFRPNQYANAPTQQSQAKGREDNQPSLNVQNLQRRASGVLPVRMEVPRAGTSHRFVKPLVIDESTVVSFRYRRR
jgi:hypothetical protein